MAKMYEFEGYQIVVSEKSNPPVRVYQFDASGLGHPLYSTTSLDDAMRWIKGE